MAPGARLKGPVTIKGYEHVTIDVTVERVEPERLLSFRWHPERDRPEARLFIRADHAGHLHPRRRRRWHAADGRRERVRRDSDLATGRGVSWERVRLGRADGPDRAVSCHCLEVEGCEGPSSRARRLFSRRSATRRDSTLSRGSAPAARSPSSASLTAAVSHARRSPNTCTCCQMPASFEASGQDASGCGNWNPPGSRWRAARSSASRRSGIRRWDV